MTTKNVKLRRVRGGRNVWARADDPRTDEQIVRDHERAKRTGTWHAVDIDFVEDVPFKPNGAMPEFAETYRKD